MDFTDQEKTMWKTAGKIPDGVYEAALKDCSLKEIKGIKKLILNFEITTGEFAGCKQTIYQKFDTENSMFHTRATLLKLGVEINDLDDLLDAVSEKIDEPFSLSVYTKDQYQNCNILESLLSRIKSDQDVPF